jgi:hypothetical protein
LKALTLILTIALFSAGAYLSLEDTASVNSNVSESAVAYKKASRKIASPAKADEGTSFVTHIDTDALTTETNKLTPYFRDTKFSQALITRCAKRRLGDQGAMDRTHDELSVNPQTAVAEISFAVDGLPPEAISDKLELLEAGLEYIHLSDDATLNSTLKDNLKSSINDDLLKSAEATNNTARLLYIFSSIEQDIDNRVAFIEENLKNVEDKSIERSFKNALRTEQRLASSMLVPAE